MIKKSLPLCLLSLRQNLLLETHFFALNGKFFYVFVKGLEQFLYSVYFSFLYLLAPPPSEGQSEVVPRCEMSVHMVSRANKLPRGVCSWMVSVPWLICKYQRYNIRILGRVGSGVAMKNADLYMTKK